MAINKEKIIKLVQRFLQKGQIEKAINELNRIIETNPKEVRLRLRIGDLYIRINKREEAIREYLKVAEIYEEKGFNLNAIAVYKQVLKIDSSLIDIYFKLASLYQKQGLIGDALIQYRRLIETYERENRIKDALDAMAKMSELDPKNKIIKMKLAELYLKEGLNDEATKVFEEIAKLLRDEDRIDEALKVYERILSFDPDNIEAIKGLAEILLEKGEYDNVLNILDERLKDNPDNIDILNIKGDIAFNKGWYEQSEYISKKIYELSPKDLNNLERLSKIYKLKEDQESLSNIYLELAKAYEERKLFDKSREIYKLIKGHEETLPSEEILIEPLTEEGIDKEIESIKEEEEELEEADVIGEEEIEVLVEESEERLESEGEGIKEQILEESKEREEKEEIASEFFDLKKELESTDVFEFLNEKGESGVEEGFGFEEIFKEFKKGVEKEVGTEDSDTHYNLGIAYKEMGLIEDAINEFKIVTKDPNKIFEGSIMIAICYKELRKYEEAISALTDALNRENIPKEELLALTYELGLIHESAGNRKEAIELFKRVMDIDSNYRNVKDKIIKKQALLENDISKNKISYI
jgi:tetratricopeptide (TPR) repeat protein